MAQACAGLPQHIGFLDGLRGFAALLVVVSHFANRTMQGIDVDAILAAGVSELTPTTAVYLAFGAFGNGAGQLGVMLFFTLSAFLMCHLYIDKAPTRANIQTFAISRVARIFPLYYFAVCLAVFSTLFLPFDYITIPIAHMPAHLIFTEGRSVLWTIAPELLFYLSFIGLWIVCGRQKQVMAVAAIALILVSNMLPVVWKSYTIEFFVLGYLIYLYAVSRVRLRLDRLPGLIALCLFAAATAFHLPAVYKVIIGDLPLNGWQNPGHLLFVLTVFLLVFEHPLLQRLFASRLLAFIGNISFSIYLLHLFVMHGLLHYGLIGPDLPSLVGTLAIIIGFSTAMFYGFETPARRLIRRHFAPQTSGHPKTETAQAAKAA